MRLYEIESEIRQAGALMEEWAAEHDGDITEFPLISNLESLELAREKKLLSLACLYKELDLKDAAFVVEIDGLKERRRVNANQRDRIKAYIAASLQPGEKMDDARAALGWRKSETVEIEGEAKDLPERFIRRKIIEEADKTAIKDALKAGTEVVGARLVGHLNLQIK